MPFVACRLLLCTHCAVTATTATACWSLCVPACIACAFSCLEAPTVLPCIPRSMLNPDGMWARFNSGLVSQVAAYLERLLALDLAPCCRADGSSNIGSASEETSGRTKMRSALGTGAGGACAVGRMRVSGPKTADEALKHHALSSALLRGHLQPGETPG